MHTLSCGMVLFFHSCGCDFHAAVQQYLLFSGNPIYFARLVAIDAIRCYIYSIDGRGGKPLCHFYAFTILFGESAEGREAS